VIWRELKKGYRYERDIQNCVKSLMKQERKMHLTRTRQDHLFMREKESELSCNALDEVMKDVSVEGMEW
jgi:hypothetical protein